MKKKSTVNKAGNYTKPTLRKRIFQRLMNSNSYGTPSENGQEEKHRHLLVFIRKQVGVIDNGFSTLSEVFEELVGSKVEN